jgi:hypothetical protein
MTSTKSGKPNGRRTLARVMLALLLTLAPLLTLAGGMPAAASADQEIVTQADQQMPCHGDAGQTADAASQAGCPHCSDGDRLSQCHCCDYAAPAALISLDLDPATAPADGIRSRLRITDPLPKSAVDRLYRPPIIQS